MSTLSMCSACSLLTLEKCMYHWLDCRWTILSHNANRFKSLSWETDSMYVIRCHCIQWWSSVGHSASYFGASTGCQCILSLERFCLKAETERSQNSNNTSDRGSSSMCRMIVSCRAAADITSYCYSLLQLVLNLNSVVNDHKGAVLTSSVLLPASWRVTADFW